MKSRLSRACRLLALSLLAASLAAGCSKGPPKHGTKLTVAPTNSVPVAEQQQALDQVAEVLRTRLRDMGIRRAHIERSTDGRLVVMVPELPSERLDRCRRVIQRAGLLEFRMVHPDSDMLIARDIPEPGYEVMALEQKFMRNGREEKSISRLLVNKQPELTGKHIKRAGVLRDRFTNKPRITFELDPEGAKKFEQLTTEWQPKGGRDYRLAIVLDGQLRSAPAIKGVISASGEISGDFTVKEALDLVTVLENPLEMPLHIVDEKSF